MLASGGMDKVVRLWDTRTNRQVSFFSSISLSLARARGCISAAWFLFVYLCGLRSMFLCVLDASFCTLLCERGSLCVT